MLLDAALDRSLRNVVVVRDGKRRTIGAIFRAQTEPIRGVGNGVGSPAAERRCERAVATATAHVCEAEELSRSASLGIAVPRGWCLEAAGGGASCGGGGEMSGAVWDEPAGRMVGVPCGEIWPVLCCD